jgi:periplasmic protein TonB
MFSTQAQEPWFKGFVRNVRDAINPPKLPPLVVTSKPIATDDMFGLHERSHLPANGHSVFTMPVEHDATMDKHLQHLLAAEVEEPWFSGFIRSLKDIVNPPKLPPLVITSKPVMVKDIWGLYGRKKQSWVMSFGFQTAAVALLFTVFSAKAIYDQHRKDLSPIVTPIDLEPYQPKMAPKKDTMQGGGGGGNRNPLPASKGRLPRAALKQFTPPSAEVLNANPKLTMEPTIIAPPDVQLPNVNMAQYGDPLGKIGPPSNGPGSGGGIGSGSGGGVGSGRGGGYGPGEGGGVGGGVFRVGGGVSAPSLLYKVEPEYSEEARKAKYQGTVVLYIEVDPSGKARNMRVIKSLGLGLDEKATEAVSKWKFRPGYKNGKPVTVQATIEVNFRLL